MGRERLTVVAIAVIAIGFVTAVFLVAPATRSRQQLMQVTKQLEWIRQSVQELSQAGPPRIGLDQGPDDAKWVAADYFVFSNGWAAYKLHSIHEDSTVGDITMLRTSDGTFYLSKMHFCCGITDMMFPQTGENHNQQTRATSSRNAESFKNGICFPQTAE